MHTYPIESEDQIIVLRSLYGHSARIRITREGRVILLDTQLPDSVPETTSAPLCRDRKLLGAHVVPYNYDLKDFVRYAEVRIDSAGRYSLNHTSAFSAIQPLYPH